MTRRRDEVGGWRLRGLALGLVGFGAGLGVAAARFPGGSLAAAAGLALLRLVASAGRVHGCARDPAGYALPATIAAVAGVRLVVDGPGAVVVAAGLGVGAAGACVARPATGRLLDRAARAGLEPVGWLFIRGVSGVRRGMRRAVARRRPRGRSS